jgi:hypothetical protein
MVVVELLSRLSYFMGRVGVGVGLGGRNERFGVGSECAVGRWDWGGGGPVAHCRVAQARVRGVG